MTTNQLQMVAPRVEPGMFPIPKPEESRPTIVLDALSWQILGALVNGPMSTPDLTAWVQEKRSKVAYRCKRLKEKFQLLESHLAKSGHQVFFFPLTGEVLTRESYPRIMAQIAALKAVDPDDPEANVFPFYPEVRVWELTGRARKYPVTTTETVH